MPVRLKKKITRKETTKMADFELGNILSSEYLDDGELLKLEGISAETLENLKDNKGEE